MVYQVVLPDALKHLAEEGVEVVTYSVGSYGLSSLDITKTGTLIADKGWIDENQILWIKPYGVTVGRSESGADISLDSLQLFFLRLHHNDNCQLFDSTGEVISKSSALIDWTNNCRLAIWGNIAGQPGIETLMCSGVLIKNFLSEKANFVKSIGTSILPFANGADLGIVGDGITDCTVALQSAIDGLRNNYKEALAKTNLTTSCNTLYLPSGVYIVSSPIIVRTNIRLLGTTTTPYVNSTDGYASLDNVNSGSIIKAATNFVGSQVLDCEADGVSIENIVVDGNSLPVGSSYPNITVTTNNGKTAYTDNFKLLVINTTYGLSIASIEVPALLLGAGIQRCQLLANGGNGQYTWSITSGSLPAGLSLSSSGLISGTPTASGTNYVTFQVRDSSNNIATTNLPVSVLSAYISSNALYDHTQGETIIPYSLNALSVSNSSQLNWKLEFAPAGMTINAATGQISGIITDNAGTYNCRVSLTDNSQSGNPQDIRYFKLILHSSTDGVIVINTGLSINPYLQNAATIPWQFRATGGGGNYVWSIDTTAVFPQGYTNSFVGYPTSTSPAPGLTLSSSGVLSGTPTQTGNFTFFAKAVSVSNPQQYFSALVIATINSPGAVPTITRVILPPAIVGQPYSGQIEASINDGSTLAYKGNVLPYGLSINQATGAITGIPLAAPVINGINLRWSAQIHNCSIRGFRNGSAIYCYGPSNLHRITGTMVSYSDVGINLATQVYDSHWQDLYVYGCRVGLNIGSGAAAHNFVNVRFEYCYEDLIQTNYANENTFTSCYFDTAGRCAISSINTNNLIINGCRFYRSGRIVRGTGTNFVTNANPQYSSHIYLSNCKTVSINGCIFQPGSADEGSDSEANVKANTGDFFRPSTGISYYQATSLTIVGNSFSGYCNDAIAYLGGDVTANVIRDNSIDTTKSTIRPNYKLRSIADPILINGGFNLWTANTNPITTAGASNTQAVTRFASMWNITHQYVSTSSQTVNFTLTKKEDAGDSILPCRYYLNIQKPPLPNAVAGTYQAFQLEYGSKAYIWELSARRVYLSFFIRGHSTTINQVIPRLQIYPATNDNNYAAYNFFGGTITVQPSWQRIIQVYNLQDLKGLQVGKNGTPAFLLDFIMNDASQNLNLDFAAISLNPVDPDFAPKDFIEISHDRLSALVNLFDFGISNTTIAGGEL